MRPLKTLLAALILSGTTILTPTLDAALIDFETSGTWQDAAGVFGFNGEGTNQINWGNPLTTSGQSGWRFDGNAGQVDPAVDGGLFRLGTFTHNNFVISNFNFLGTVLDLTITIDGVDLDLAVAITHLETPNSGNPCAAGGAQPCPDLVTFTVIDQLVSANGRDYRVTGFYDAFGSSVQSFLTLENQVNSADLFARIEDETPPVAAPEPGTLFLVGAGCLLVGRLRKRQSQR